MIVVVAWDIVATLLHPTARGPISYLANRVMWRGARAVSSRLLGGRGLDYAGPLAVVTNVLGWVLGMWLGYALVYLPFIEGFSYDPTTPFGAKGFAEAVYVSGAALTTAGFGDVVAANDVLRLVTLVQAATGFGVLSAAIAFVLSLYPLITQLRSAGLQLADTGALRVEGAVEVVEHAGPSELAAVVRELTQSHENLRRFPVLYYFESGNREESLTALLRGSTLLLVALHCGPSAGVGHAPVYAEALERTITRVLDDLERDFAGGRGRKARKPTPGGDAAERLRALSETLRPEEADRDEPESELKELGDFVARAEAVLAVVAHEHGQDPRPILPE
jgi:voltage-gated potassium channel Kch